MPEPTTYDEQLNKGDVDTDRRKFLTTTATVVGGAGAVMAAVPFVSSLQPSERTKAIGAPVEVDFPQLQPGQMMTATWRGRPVWIVRRTKEDIDALATPAADLRDPNSTEAQQPAYAQNKYRSLKPEYLVVMGVCTHLGCSPTYVPAGTSHNLGPDWKGGFFCPCHGSRFDLAGRVVTGVPAPLNLEVPPHQYLSDTRLLVGEDKEGAA